MEPLPPEQLNSALLSLEHQLRAFVPQLPQTSREQLLYQAGWEAALAQHAASTSTSAPVPLQHSLRPGSKPSQATYYWAAACAALLLLSTTFGWKVWQHPQSGAAPSIVTTKPTAPTPEEIPTAKETPHTAPAVAITEETLLPEAALSMESPPSALASYLDLRQRVTRGGLSMWSVSTPARVEPAASPVPARDWQAELLREAL